MRRPGWYDEAIECFRKAIELEPTNPVVTNLGVALAARRSWTRLLMQTARRRLGSRLTHARRRLASALTPGVEPGHRSRPAETRSLPVLSNWRRRLVELDANVAWVMQHARRGALPSRRLERRHRRARKVDGAPKGGDAIDGLLAMAHWHSVTRTRRARWYDRAVEWMDRTPSHGEELTTLSQRSRRAAGCELRRHRPTSVNRRRRPAKSQSPKN